MRDNTHLRSAFLTSSAMCLALTATSAAAQEDDLFLGTIVLGESKREVQTDTAVPITEIDQTEIDDRQAGTVAELIDSVPGVSLVNGSTPSGSGINIRGFGANGTFGTDQKVLILVDGATTGSEEIYRIGTQLFTDPELYRSVSVIRGTVGSFEFGTGVVGGVVQLETKDASDFTGGEPGFAFRQTLQGTTNGDGLTSSSIIAWQPNERTEFLANYTWRQQNEQVDGDGTVIGNSAFELPSYLLKGRVSFGNDNAQSVTLSFSETTAAERDVPYDTFITTTDLFGNVDRDIATQTASLTYAYNPPGNDLVDLEVILSYANQEIDQEYVPGSSSCEADPVSCFGPMAPPNALEIFLLPTVNADLQFETTKLTVRNSSVFTTGAITHDLRTGFELIRRDRKDAAAAPGGIDDRFAVFAVNDMDFGNGLTVTPAVRYETSSIEGTLDDGTEVSYDNDALVGGLSVRYAFGNGAAVFASAAYTESLPILDDLENPIFMEQSEKATTYEIGASYDGFDVFSQNDNLAVKANAYSTELRDVTSYFGVDQVEIQGVELEAAYAMGSGFYVDLNANFVMGDEFSTDGERSDWRNAPANSARATIGQRFGEELDLSWEVVAAADKDLNGDTTPGFAVHNLRATYLPQEGVLAGTEIRLGVENMFDRTYTPFLSTRPAPGRNIKLTLAKTF